MPLVKRENNDEESNNDFLKDASFLEILNYVDNFYKGRTVRYENFIRTSISIPISVTKRFEILSKEFNLSIFKIYSALIIFGFFRLYEYYGEYIELAGDFRMKLAFMDEDNMSRLFYSYKPRWDTIKNGEYRKINVDIFYYEQMKRLAELIGAKTTTIIRMAMYKSIKNLEENHYVFDNVPKGKFDEVIKEFEDAVKFKGDLAKMGEKMFEGGKEE